MKTIKMQNCSANTIFSGVYKINFPNGKVYIGISNHMYRRMIEHNSDFRNNLPVEHAIQKYGKITEFEILELIPAENRDLMQKKEQYWINFYDSTNREKGYNISLGGDGANLGSNNSQAKFTEEEIQKIYKDLAEKLDISLEQLANKYNINISSMSRINNGQTYYHSSVIYPIRSPKECKKIIAGTKNSNSYIMEDTLQLIYFDLVNKQDLSMKKIAEKYNVSSTIIQNINLGKTYHNPNFTYPLRESKTGARKLTDDQVLEIIDYIQKHPKRSFNFMADEFGVNSKTISAINIGKIYRQNGFTYPIRQKH